MKTPFVFNDAKVIKIMRNRKYFVFLYFCLNFFNVSVKYEVS